ncbi:MAG TPA: pyridoxal 5'-phosphate synthase glutaminase subunit PdxT [Candidatus Eremiobacteraceae bacterium]|nr:pyridoxal 5'-phosphate synthase glutaminase subunit PdxT [Candidatus Eremiobacteraceae bacterium]
MSKKTVIGVLSLQGDVDEHIHALRNADAKARGVKTSDDLEKVDGLVMPGGESTTLAIVLERFGLVKPLRALAARGTPIWGTCMGMIMMARSVVGSAQPTLGFLDIEVKRNAFGRQVESSELRLNIDGIDGKPFPGVFIRAPWIERAGRDAKILARVNDKGVMVRQGAFLGTSFHPELTDDARVHRYFVEMVERVLGKG